MPKYGYARVSSAGQALEEQISALTAAGCHAVRAEKASAGSREGRTELETLLAFIRSGDELVVTRIDRLARSLQDLLAIVQALESKGASLKALHQQIDTSGAAGRAFLQMLGVFAEFERSLIRDRQTAGIAKARAEGRSLGGAQITIPRADIARLLAEQIKPNEIARRLSIGRASVYRIKRELEVAP